MKRIKLIKNLIVLVLFSTLISFSVSAQHTGLIDRLDKIDRLKVKLNLNETQVNQIKAVIQNNYTDADFNRKKLNDLHEEFKTEKNSANPDSRKINKLIDSISKERADNLKKRYAIQSQIKSYLTPEQVTKLKSLINEKRKDVKRF